MLETPNVMLECLTSGVGHVWVWQYYMYVGVAVWVWQYACGYGSTGRALAFCDWGGGGGGGGARIALTWTHAVCMYTPCTCKVSLALFMKILCYLMCLCRRMQLFNLFSDIGSIYAAWLAGMLLGTWRGRGEEKRRREERRGEETWSIRLTTPITLWRMEFFSTGPHTQLTN